MWQNFLYVSVDLQEFSQALYAMKEILRLKEKEVDVEILRRLCKAIALDILDAKGQQGSLHMRQLVELLDQIANNLSAPDIWAVYAEFYHDLNDKEKVVCLIST
jgi:hypothetical protein